MCLLCNGYLDNMVHMAITRISNNNNVTYNECFDHNFFNDQRKNMKWMSIWKSTKMDATVFYFFGLCCAKICGKEGSIDQRMHNKSINYLPLQLNMLKSNIFPLHFYFISLNGI